MVWPWRELKLWDESDKVAAVISPGMERPREHLVPAEPKALARAGKGSQISLK